MATNAEIGNPVQEDNSEREKPWSLEEIKSHIVSPMNENDFNKLEESLQAIQSTNVLIGVIGTSAVGKSSFINNMLGLDEDDEEAAQVGDGDTTVKRKVYEHPKNKQLAFSDLPGFGTPTFKKDSYLEKIEANKHDFFLLFYATAISEDHDWLIRKLLHLKKKFAIVRSRADDMTGRKKISLQESIEKVKEKARKNLVDFGILEKIEIFVISNKYPEIGEFTRLLSFITMSLQSIQREMIILYVHAISDTVIEDKKHVLLSRAWKVAACMGTLSEIIIPSLGVHINRTIIAKEVLLYLDAFGLNSEVLESYPMNIKEKLKTAMKINTEGVGAYIKVQVKKAFTIVTLEMLEQAILRHSIGAGKVICALKDFVEYFNFLKESIDNLAEEATILRKHHVESVYHRI